MRLLFPVPRHHMPTSFPRTATKSRCFSTSVPHFFSRTPATFKTMEVELSAPNGKKWTQPLGLFVNNEFIKSGNDQKLASINPA